MLTEGKKSSVWRGRLSTAPDTTSHPFGDSIEEHHP
jgi:hypothetical protein